MKSAQTAPSSWAGLMTSVHYGQKSFFFCPTHPKGGTAMKDFEEIIQEKGLPSVRQTVRSKDYGTLWRVMEKRELWQAIADDPQTGQPRLTPAIYLSYWRIQEGRRPGVGKMMGFTYTLYDNTFALHWDIVP
jgi:hypothetical protein